MNPVLGWFLAALLLPGQSAPPPSALPMPDAPQKALVVALSRDYELLEGGLGTTNPAPKGVAGSEPIAWIMPDGQWVPVPCAPLGLKPCRQWARNYLGHPRRYKVLTAPAYGTEVEATAAKLSECFDFSSNAHFDFPNLPTSSLATDNPEIFAPSEALTQMSGKEAWPILDAFFRTVPIRLSSVRYFHVYAFELEGQELYVVQRNEVDYPREAEVDGDQGLIFAIGSMSERRFHLLHWKQNTGDEEQHAFAMLHLKSGREFLVTTTNDPESHRYEIFGIRNGRLSLVFRGGGSSC